MATTNLVVFFVVQLIFLHLLVYLVYGNESNITTMNSHEKVNQNISLQGDHLIFNHSIHHSNILKGVVLSNNLMRFNSTRKCLSEVGFYHIMMLSPINYLSQTVDYDYHNMTGSDTDLSEKLRKVISNRLTFVKGMKEFMYESPRQSHNNGYPIFLYQYVPIYQYIPIHFVAQISYRCCFFVVFL